MITHTVYLPVADLPLLLLLFVATPSLCVLATKWAERHERRGVAKREREADERDRLQDIRSDRLDVREDNLDDREEALASREQALVRQAKETQAAVAADAEHFDTMISLLDIDDLPHPYENEPTIQMRPVTETATLDQPRRCPDCHEPWEGTPPVIYHHELCPQADSTGRNRDPA